MIDIIKNNKVGYISSFIGVIIMIVLSVVLNGSWKFVPIIIVGYVVGLIITFVINGH